MNYCTNDHHYLAAGVNSNDIPVHNYIIYKLFFEFQFLTEMQIKNKYLLKPFFTSYVKSLIYLCLFFI